jgi:hypothetical protein
MENCMRSNFCSLFRYSRLILPFSAGKKCQIIQGGGGGGEWVVCELEI